MRSCAHNIVVFALSVSLLGSCAEERPVRSFVQPNLLKKSDLAGEWYYVQTVLDAPPSNGVMFNGLSSELIRGRFDIQQDFLYFRRSYEQIGGSEDMRRQDGNGFYGQPLAAWRITRHFDLIRDYNPVTGEQTNRIIETEERPWQQREFIRVDWSRNEVVDYVGIGLNLFFSRDEGVSIQPVSFWEADPTRPDGVYKEFQPVPRDREGRPLEGEALAEFNRRAEFKAGELRYFDVTNKIMLTPREVTLKFEENGVQETLTFPRCFLLYQIDDCASQIIKVRHGFARVSPKHQYSPRRWDGKQMERFGLWDVGLNRLTYNRQYGITNSGFVRTAARFNIWKQTFPIDEQGYIRKISCESDDECGEGMQCGPYYDNQSGADRIINICQIHPRNREIRTIPYYAESSLRERRMGRVGEYLVDVFPADLFDSAREAVRQWNEAFKAAYTAATKSRRPEDMLSPDNTGRQADRDIFVLCHNPVKLRANEEGPADPEACWQDLEPLRTFDRDGRLVDVIDENGDRVYRVRQGDPRRSTIFWVHQFQAMGPLGYGPPLYDPQTGETISGQAYIYGAVIDTYAARSRDLAMLLVGQISTQDFIRGVDVSRWVQQNREGSLNRETFTQKELLERALAMDFSWAQGLAPEAPLDTETVERLRETMRARSERVLASRVFGVGEGNPAAERLRRLRNTPIESMLIQADQLAGLSGGTPVKWDALSDAEKARVSPLRNLAIQQAIEERKERMAALGVDHADFFEESIYQRVLQARKDPALLEPGNNRCEDAQGNRNQPCFNAEALRKDLRKRIFLGVTLHEMGHNVGLRHNFRSSYDAMNYFQQYWDLRDRGRTATRDCYGRPYPPAQPGDPNEGRLRPRWVNRPGGALSEPECQGGIREYQYSSIMDYGSEFNADIQGLGSYDKAAIKFSIAEYYEVFTEAKQDRLDDWSALQEASSAYGLPTPLAPGRSLTAIPYTQYPDFFDNGVRSINKRAEIPMELARNIGRQNTVYGVRKGNRVYPVVPYYFCSDEFAGNLTCQRFDAGADAFEQAQDLVSRYNNFYLVNNFKRDRFQFWASAAYLARIRSRYFELLRQQMTWYTLLRGEFTDFLVALARANLSDPNEVQREVATFFADERQWGSFTAAVSLGFDTFGHVLSRPSYGSFIQVPDDDSSDFPGSYWKQFRDRPFQDPSIRNIPIGQGRHENTTWDFEGCGYYWYEQCMTRIGYFHDKRVALEILTESQAYFTGRDTATDVRKYAIGYFRLFPAQLQDKFGAILAGDYAGYAPRFTDAMGNMTQRSWTTGRFSTAVVPPADAIVEPATGFTLQVLTGLRALAEISSGFDRDIIENTQIFIVGNGEAPVSDSMLWPPDVPGTLSTANPNNLKAACDPNLNSAAFKACVDSRRSWLVYAASNGRIYAARSVPRRLATSLSGVVGEPLRLDTGARMLEMLRTLDLRHQAALALPENHVDRNRRVAVTERALRNYIMNIEVMRSLHKAFGYGPFKTDAPFVF
ncbi:MAG: hypothetical protein RMK29_02360 [Myxococcales bacterium]|nr:hypothetical protein [Myxococcota bacterium]MDW8280524.1 hypothetical protein [Myxococcales bacterium]